MLKIVRAPHPALTKEVRQVKKIDKKIRELVYDMEETLIAQVDPQGVGLAAPQVNVNLAIFIIKPTLKSETLVFINPKILEVAPIRHPEFAVPLETDKRSEGSKSQKEMLKPAPQRGEQIQHDKNSEDVKLEGCLSIPRIWGPVIRNTKILLEYKDLTGEKHTSWFSGFKSVIIQHEMDHLQGILFTQRILEQKGRLYQEKDGELEKIEG